MKQGVVMTSTYERHQHIQSVIASLIMHAIILALLYYIEHTPHTTSLQMAHQSSVIEFVTDTATGNSTTPVTAATAQQATAATTPPTPVTSTPTTRTQPTTAPIQSVPAGLPLSSVQGLRTPPPSSRVQDWHTNNTASTLQAPYSTQTEDTKISDSGEPTLTSPITNIPTAQHGRAAVTGKQSGVPYAGTGASDPDEQVNIPTTFGQLAQGLLHSAATANSVRLAALPTENKFMLLQQYKAKAWSWLRQSFYGHQRLFHISRSLETKVPLVMTIAKDGTFLDIHFACHEKSQELKEVESILLRTARLAGLFPPIPRALDVAHITMSLDFGVFVKEGFHTYDICIGVT
jgi:hypothetical protein